MTGDASSSPVGRDPSLPGVYVHVPFCARRCDYCAFAAWSDRGHLIERYMRALRRDVERTFGAPSAPSAVGSVFVGGGTPTAVPAASLGAVLRSIPLARGAEVTVEANPDSLDATALAVLQEAGCNRVSMGVQSMVPHVLASLGRTHDPANVVSLARTLSAAGLRSWNVDLIYGAVGETAADWRATVESVLELGPPHVSAYALTVEPGTPLARDAARHPDDDDQAEKYEVADDLLTASGRPWYEISNWAVPGHECRHNALYWEGGEYLAFGCAAHGHRAGRRWWNVATPERYIDAVEGDGSPVASGEELDAAARRREARQLALRTRRGVPTAAFTAEMRQRFDGLLRDEGDRLVLTRRGRLLANEVAMGLTDEPVPAPQTGREGVVVTVRSVTGG